jgi:glycosyltransferase involved in cell wall biosynthesis
VFTIPCAVDVDRSPQAERPTDVVVAAPKAPALGRRVARRLHRGDRRVDLIDEFLPRAEFLERIGCAKVGVTLPHRTEGFFLPAIETMALGTILVCPDCTANRSFCLDGVNCFRPDYEEDAIVAAGETALSSLPELGQMVDEGFATARRHSLEAERDAFLAVLDRIDELWAAKGGT